MKIIAGLVFCVLFSVLAGHAQPRDAARPLILASYNLKNYLTGERTTENGTVEFVPKPEEEKQAVVSVICAVSPDILGVIEIGNGEDLSDLRSRLTARGLDYPYHYLHEGADKTRRLAILSRYPLVENHSRDRIGFEIDGRPHSMQRGILDVVVRIPSGRDLRLVGVHLKSRRPVPEVDESLLRLREAAALRAHVSRILTEDPAALLAVFGDLNDTRQSAAVREVLGVRGGADSLVMLELADAQGDRWTHHWDMADEYSRIDYILASRALARFFLPEHSGVDRSEFWSRASDHRLIYAAFDLN